MDVLIRTAPGLGEIGRRKALKMPRACPYRFDSGSPDHPPLCAPTVPDALLASTVAPLAFQEIEDGAGGIEYIRTRPKDGGKAAGRLYVECLAQELGKRNVTVNGVVPGPLRDAGVIANLQESDYQALAQLSPFARLGCVADVEGAVLFLASDDAAWISGHHLVVNGAAKV